MTNGKPPVAYLVLPNEATGQAVPCLHNDTGHQFDARRDRMLALKSFGRARQDSTLSLQVLH